MSLAMPPSGGNTTASKSVHRLETKRGLRVLFWARGLLCKPLLAWLLATVLDTLFPSFMRPGTRHYVLTLKPTMVFGKHFYSSSTLRETCFSLVHTLLADNIITNTSHARLTHYIGLFPEWWLDYLFRLAKDPSLVHTDPSECHFHCPLLFPVAARCL